MTTKAAHPESSVLRSFRPKSVFLVLAIRCTGALQAAGAIATDNACTSLELKPLGATGVFGEMIVCSWTFAKETDLPAEVVCKFPQKEKFTRLLAAVGGMYELELHYCTICYKLSPEMTGFQSDSTGKPRF